MEDFNFSPINKPFDWWYLDYLKEEEIKYSIDALFDLNKNQENSLEESKKKTEEYLRLTPRDERNNEFMYEAENTIKELQRLQRYSMTMVIFSFYESKLKMLCEMIEKRNAFKLRIKDLYGKGIIKYWTYLHKIFEIDINELEDIFNELDKIRLIRNSIVHNDGVINDCNKKKIKNKNGISINHENLIIIEKDIYTKYQLDTIKSFFDILLVEIDKRQMELKK